MRFGIPNGNIPGPAVYGPESRQFNISGLWRGRGGPGLTWRPRVDECEAHRKHLPVQRNSLTLGDPANTR